MSTEETLSLDELAKQIAKQYPTKEDLLGDAGVFQELFSEGRFNRLLMES